MQLLEYFHDQPKKDVYKKIGGRLLNDPRLLLGSQLRVGKDLLQAASFDERQNTCRH